MPTTAEIRESAEQVASRLHALTTRSVQQVRTLASRSADYVQHKFIAFSDSCRGQKNGDDTQTWSTSERNSQNRDSSKDLTAKSACEEKCIEKREYFFSFP
jgi:hypothetical protein